MNSSDAVLTGLDLFVDPDAIADWASAADAHACGHWRRLLIRWQVSSLGPGTFTGRVLSNSDFEDHMRLLLLKVCALVVALGVVAFVIQASRSRARQPAEPAPLPAASGSATAADAGPPASNPYGIIGPATKADPHVMRRAAESIEQHVLEAPAATSAAPVKP